MFDLRRILLKIVYLVSEYTGLAIRQVLCTKKHHEPTKLERLVQEFHRLNAAVWYEIILAGPVDRIRAFILRFCALAQTFFTPAPR